MTEPSERSDPLDLAGVWEQHAAWWQAGFTGGADVEYDEQILPMAARHLAGASHVLDLGCGEGQIARLAAAGGAARAVGVDASDAQIREARRRGGGPSYLRGRPPVCPSGRAGATPGGVPRARAPGGPRRRPRRGRPRGLTRWAVRGVRQPPPVPDPGQRLGRRPGPRPAQADRRVGPYLPETVTVEEVDRDVRLPFFHRPLGRYVNALAERGLYLTRMTEPAPPPRFLALAPQYQDAATIPRPLALRAERR